MDNEHVWDLIVQYGNACFDCGHWREKEDTDDEWEPYGILVGRVDAARDKLRTALELDKLDR